jgi:hypothetical protein
MSYKVESEFIHNGLPCVVIFTDMGDRCGYVGVFENNLFYKIKYSDNVKNKKILNSLKKEKVGKRGIMSLMSWDGENVSPHILFDVHGSITYSGQSESYPIKTDGRVWWFGFDCAHSGDRKDRECFKDYFPDKFSTIDNIGLFEFESGVVRTKEYVTIECKRLADQLTQYNY